jgi:hypothetical protein
MKVEILKKKYIILSGLMIRCVVFVYENMLFQLDCLIFVTEFQVLWCFSTLTVGGASFIEEDDRTVYLI